MIKGLVIDQSTNRPLQGVYVLLNKTIDSSLVTGVVTEKTGKFELKSVAAGEYFVKFSIIGYAEKTTSVFTISKQRRRLNLETISLEPVAVNLNEVSVTADKLIFNQSIDRKVYNIDQDIIGKVGSASELLENIPSVQVDLNGIVSLRGSSSVVMMINGKTSPLLDRRSGVYLEQLPANSIEKIEVITNPSAKYTSDGKAGIINIVLKKNTALGIHGNLAANAGDNGRYNGHIRLNYNPGDYNLYGSYSLRRDNRNRFNSDFRIEQPRNNPSPSSTAYYTDDLSSNSTPLTHSVMSGFDYFLDGQNTVGASVTFYQNSFTRIDSSLRILRSSSNFVLTQYERNSTGYEFEKEFGITSYLHHNFSKEAHKLSLEYTTSRTPREGDNHFSNDYTEPPNPPTSDNSFVKQHDTKNQLSLDYTNPVTESSTIEAGYAGEFNSANLDYYAESFDTSQQVFVGDANKTSRFLYHEAINSLYLSYKQSIGRLGLQAGIRAEHDGRNFEMVTADSEFSNSYLNYFPSLHISYKFTETTELQLSYSRRSNRPRARDLNPFPEFRDPKNITLGNPHLIPEYTHSLELGCQWQNDHFSILPSLYYRYANNSMTTIRTIVNRTTLLTTKDNLANEQTTGLEMIFSVNSGSFFTAHLSATGFYNQIDASNIGFDQNKNTVSWSGTFTSTLNFTKSSRFQINSHFNSARLTPQGKYFPSSVVNMGFRQDISDGKVSLVFTVSDVFNMLRRKFELDIPRLHQTDLHTRESRIVFLGFTYRIGISPSKAKEEQMHYDDDF